MENSENKELKKQSSEAENILAWKELLSSKEAKEFLKEILEKSIILFGQTPEAKKSHTLHNITLMVVAFTCIGLLAYFKLLADGTTGVLAGIIIGYFFKKED